jgi:DNA mismatch endonuclease (patch repair protein)
MVDDEVTAARSALMGRIRSRDTEPETLLRAAQWARGLRYRLNARTPVGKADIVVPGQKLAVFIDGCFWHGCPDHYVRPRSRADFWAAKLLENTTRDIRQTAALEALGWRAVRVWEHDVHESLPAVVEEILIPAGPNGRLAWRVFQVDEHEADPKIERRHLRELRSLAVDRVVEQQRHTRKWKRPPKIAVGS